MEESVILNNPIVLVGFIAALVLCSYGLIKKRVSALRLSRFFSFSQPRPMLY